MQHDTNQAQQAPDELKDNAVWRIIFWFIWGLVFGFLLPLLYDFYDACTNPIFPIPSEIGWRYSSIEAYASAAAANIIILSSILTAGVFLKSSRWIFIILAAFFFAAPQFSNTPYKSAFWEYPAGRLLLPLTPELDGTLCLRRHS